ncbi:MAG: replication-associated recombination protein A [Christensenellales bacterium]|jgi:putative ATPase
MEDLFSAASAENANRNAPLADRMRPRTLDEFFGQSAIVGEGRLLRRAILADRLTSCIFWGPPGTGKTTLACIIANQTKSAFRQLNAVTSGVADVRQIISEAENAQRMYGTSTYLLLDECHRWNKAQSDSILPAIEKGTLRFIGSTTENPMIAMTPAIVSRCRLFRFEKLSEENILHILSAAVSDTSRGYGNMSVILDADAARHIAQVAEGDARAALNALELAVLSTPIDKDGAIHVTVDVAAESIQSRVIQMDESMFYDMLSAFCKSLRGSDSDAALAWFARMARGGVDPRIIVRRVIAHASEDVGLANPNALLTAVAAGQALEMLGMPEAKLAITQAIVTVCESPKSNAVVTAVDRAMEDAERGDYQNVPVHLRDTSYKGASKLGSGEGYLYPHNFPNHYVKQQYAPLEAKGMPYYEPSEEGFEKEIRKLRKERGI